MSRSSHFPTRMRQGAFTLIELMVVIAMLGLFMGVVFLRMDSLLPGNRLASNARELASVLEQARDHSVVSGRRVQVDYDLDGRAYRAYYPFELSEDGKSIAGEGETVVVDWKELSDTIRFLDVRVGEGDPIGSGVVTVFFDPRGIATAHAVHLRVEEREAYYSVLVSPLLGYVDVEEGIIESEVLNENAF